MEVTEFGMIIDDNDEYLINKLGKRYPLIGCLYVLMQYFPSDVI
jgi:hypothetical protein